MVKVKKVIQDALHPIRLCNINESFVFEYDGEQVSPEDEITNKSKLKIKPKFNAGKK